MGEQSDQVQTNMLIKLSNGVWLDPKAVTAIGKDREDKETIIIHLLGSGPMLFWTTDDQQMMIDAIATLINKSIA